MKRISKRKLIERLTEDAYFEPILDSMRSHSTIFSGTPGERIQKLSPEEREVLKTMTSKDWNTYFIKRK